MILGPFLAPTLALWSAHAAAAPSVCAGSGAFVQSSPQDVAVQTQPLEIGPWRFPSSPLPITASRATDIGTDARASITIWRNPTDTLTYARVRIAYPFAGYGIPFSIEKIRLEWRSPGPAASAGGPGSNAGRGVRSSREVAAARSAREARESAIDFADIDFANDCSETGRSLFPGGDWSVDLKIAIPAAQKSIRGLRVFVLGQRA